MLQSFLRKNKGALCDQFNYQNEHQPPSSTSRLGPWLASKENSKGPTVTAPTSPTYQRKRIFQRESSPSSKVTAAFRTGNLEESKVESYRMVSVGEESEEEATRIKVKRAKLAKENGLCLKECDRPFKKNLRSMETIPSTLKEIMPESSECIEGRGKGGGSSASESLKVVEGLELFTFNSEREAGSSSESGWMGKRVESGFGFTGG